MITNPDLNVRAILAEMQLMIESPQRIDQPMSDIDRAAEGEKVRELAADPSKVHIICIACEDAAPLLSAHCCICGGFLCPACAELEGEGACEHERPAMLEGVGDDE